jgi:uncharacterized NAD(P)/FAD-binding protein YdhS
MRLATIRIAIIGSGMSSHLLCANLLKGRWDVDLDITVIDKEPRDKVGFAYATDERSHLLNVVASSMSIDNDRQEDFVDWLTEKGYPGDGRSYVPRGLYRNYVLDRSGELISGNRANAKFTFIHDQAVDILMDKKVILLKSGQEVRFDKGVLAIGNFQKTQLKMYDGSYTDIRTYSNWYTGVDKDLSRSGTVFIVGTGLTMADAVLSLNAGGFEGQVVALSRRGLMPIPESGAKAYPSFYSEVEGLDKVLDIFKVIRSKMSGLPDGRMDAGPVVDSLRPHILEVWMKLSMWERKDFLEHLSPIWNMCRHRIPRESFEVIKRWVECGRLKIVSGRIAAIGKKAEGNYVIEYLKRQTRERVRINADAILNCMGPELDYSKVDCPLVKRLIAKGIVIPDSLQLGLQCCQDGSLTDRAGHSSTSLYTLGATRRGIVWESTAVPEIREQARKLSGILVSNSYYG